MFLKLQLIFAHKLIIGLAGLSRNNAEHAEITKQLAVVLVGNCLIQSFYQKATSK